MWDCSGPNLYIYTVGPEMHHPLREVPPGSGLCSGTLQASLQGVVAPRLGTLQRRGVALDSLTCSGPVSPTTNIFGEVRGEGAWDADRLTKRYRPLPPLYSGPSK